MIQKPHRTCENHPVKIVWEYQNPHGMPAVVCEVCKPTKRSALPGKFICWLNQTDVAQLENKA